MAEERLERLVRPVQPEVMELTETKTTERLAEAGAALTRTHRRRLAQVERVAFAVAVVAQGVLVQASARRVDWEVSVAFISGRFNSLTRSGVRGLYSRNRAGWTVGPFADRKVVRSKCHLRRKPGEVQPDSLSTLFYRQPNKFLGYFTDDGE